MRYVRNLDQAARARRRAYHGLAQQSGYGAARIGGQWWTLDVAEPGRRVIGNDLSAAVGSVQLHRLPDLVARRRELVASYSRDLAGLEALWLPPPLPDGHESSYYFHWVQFTGGIRDRVAAQLYPAGIYTTFRYEPPHRVPIFGAVEAAR